jgi:hypothetical protein
MASDAEDLQKLIIEKDRDLKEKNDTIQRMVITNFFKIIFE